MCADLSGVTGGGGSACCPGVPSTGRLPVNAPCSLRIHPTDKQKGCGIPPSFGPNVDSDEVISGVRFAVLKMVLVPVTGGMIQACYGAVGGFI